MTCQELATAALEELPIVVVIVNNGYLGMVRQWQDMFFEERFSQIKLTHTLPDYAALARAYGALGFTPRTPPELGEALAQALPPRPPPLARPPPPPPRPSLPVIP